MANEQRDTRDSPSSNLPATTLAEDEGESQIETEVGAADSICSNAVETRREEDEAREGTADDSMADLDNVLVSEHSSAGVEGESKNSEDVLICENTAASTTSTDTPQRKAPPGADKDNMAACSTELRPTSVTCAKDPFPCAFISTGKQGRITSQAEQDTTPENSEAFLMDVVRERSMRENTNIAAAMPPTEQEGNHQAPVKPRAGVPVGVGAHDMPGIGSEQQQDDDTTLQCEIEQVPSNLGAQSCGSSTLLTAETSQGSQITFTVPQGLDASGASSSFAASMEVLFGSTDIPFLEATLVEDSESPHNDHDVRTGTASRASAMTRSRGPSSGLLVFATPVNHHCCWTSYCNLKGRSKVLLGTALCLVLALGIGLGLGLGLKGSSDTAIPTLQDVRERGVLRCGVGSHSPALHFYDENGERSGFDVTLCRAIAAAVLGDDAQVEFKVVLANDRFLQLINHQVDVVAAGVTHTMEREVNEASTQTGFSFSSAYLYEGLQLAGDPHSVGCIENDFKNTEGCSLIKVCVIEGTSHYAVLSSKLPGRQLHIVDTYESMIQSFVAGDCLVLAHEGHQLEESGVRDLGYRGPYSVGHKILSKDPLCLMSRKEDPQWATFVNSVLHSLLLAEKYGISKAAAENFPQTNVFGDPYINMFRNAIAAGGNYGEMYAQYLEPVIPRKQENLLNDHSQNQSGLLYSSPLGTAENNGNVAADGYLEHLQAEGKVRCGILPKRPGFATVPAGEYSYQGIEVDLCRALTAALFDGFASKFELVPVISEEEGYSALAEGAVDVLAGASWSFQSYTREVGTDNQISFSPPYFYNNTATDHKLENLCLATSAGYRDWSSFVYWTVMGIIQAEENGVSMEESNAMPEVNLFGLDYSRMFRDTVLTVGNYGQLYNRSLQELYPREGRNLLNDGSNAGPLHYAIPGLF